MATDSVTTHNIERAPGQLLAPVAPVLAGKIAWLATPPMNPRTISTTAVAARIVHEVLRG